MDIWKGKIAVVTGASSGIGAQISLDLSKAEVTVLALARREDRLQELAKESPNIVPILCDISDPVSIQDAFKHIKNTFGKINILINNAGQVRDGTILDTNKPNANFAGTIDVNLRGVIICTREAFKLMECHEEPGFIINISSVLGQISPQSKFLPANVYPATKHALNNFTEMVRLELASKGLKRIRITVSKGIFTKKIYYLNIF